MPHTNRFMRRAFELAWQVCGDTFPRPAVGAVAVKGDTVVGEGATSPRPGNHAEINALEMAGERARGSTLYTTLEPHSVRSLAKPCCEAIAEAGVAKVVVALNDPAPAENGKGVAFLKRAGVEVEYGGSEDAAEAELLVEGFRKRMLSGMPFLTAKIALSLDGRLADDSGSSQWISGMEARRRVHKLRGQADAILTGIGTVLADNPRLTVREGNKVVRYPARIVLDSNGRLPQTSQLLNQSGSVLVFTAPGYAPPASAAGAKYVEVAAAQEGLDLKSVMVKLGEFGFNWVLAECGGKLLGNLLKEGLVDRVEAFIAPKLILGKGSYRISSDAPSPLAEALKLKRVKHKTMGDDILISGYLN